jgi:hypothetical protein
MKVTVKRVPSEYISGIKKLAAFDDQIAESLIETLRELPLALDRQQLITQVVDHVQGVNDTEVEELLRVLFSLCDLCANTDLSSNELSSQISKAAAKEQELSHLSPQQIIILEDRLRRLLDAGGTIASSYKAQVVLGDHKYLFANARVFTDMRPIFDSDASSEPLAIGIVHTLKVQYRGLEGANEFFVTLDKLDLKQMEQEIQRAIKKEDTIRAMLDRVDLRCLESENTD